MKQRQTELDVLRFLAMVEVIIFHICGGGLDLLKVSTPEWITLNCYYASSTWQVPIFVMISGRFLLEESRNISIKQVIEKYIRRLVIAFVFWTAVYQAFAVAYCKMNGLSYLNMKGILTEAIRGANVKKKLGQCSKKTRPPALLKNQATRP